MIIKKTEKTKDYSMKFTLKTGDTDYIQEYLIKSIFPPNKIEQPGRTIQPGETSSNQPEIQHDVVAIYDNAGIPSIMHRFRKVTNKELFGGSDKIHSAFVIDGKVYDEIYISVYENCEINGKPYSLPYQKSWVNITNDEAAEACFSKGEGWHLLTAAEWGLLANLSLKNGTLPHGNTNKGSYHADADEHGEVYDGTYTLTGSGPSTWTHDHTPEGVHDLCGNHWEMVRGLRIKDGRLQTVKDNNAALDIDLTPKGNDWRFIHDESRKNISISVSDDRICVGTMTHIEQGGTCCRWSEVEIACESEQLKELAWYAGEQEAYLRINNDSDEYFPNLGGGWISGSGAGLFCTILSNWRYIKSSGIGFRSAYFKKN